MPRRVLPALALALVTPLAAAGDAPQRPRQPGGRGGVYRDQVTPHWFADNTRFWYRNDLRGGAREFVLVDAVKGTRGPAFDHKKLAAALSKAAGTEYSPEKLPFDRVEFVEEGKAVRFRVGGQAWKCDLGKYECVKEEGKRPAPRKTEEGPTAGEGADRSADADALPEGRAVDPIDLPRSIQKQRPGAKRGNRSPDGKWTALVKDGNVFVKDADGTEAQLSKDGKPGNAYDWLTWSPDSKALVAFRVEPGERKEVHLIESSPRDGGRARLTSRPYALPGDRFTAYEINLFDPATRKQVKPRVERVDFGFPNLRWKKDGRHFTYQKVDRGHQRFRVVEIDSHTGQARDLIDEKSKTFIWTAHAVRGGNSVHYLDDSDEMIYVSEMDGWRHLYLYDGKAGKLKHQVTKGEWVVRAIDRVDEAKRQVWFRATGKNPGQDPYLVHFCRVDLDGKNLVALTEGDGTHQITYSPDRKYLIDRYSRVDLPPVHELRRADDGKLVVKLEEADVADLKKAGWEAPQVFTAKGRDGKTDIWGIICRPRDFDPKKKYPVVEYIYAGPHDSHVPKQFAPYRHHAALADLGFVVVQIDGMGTANRSKAFHDVCWQNLKDAGFPDRIAWHKAAARKYPWYDTGRVGIFGTSAGGQNAMGALLFHGDFYKAAVASCGCHDNRMDKASWNEQWMGYPVGKHYAECSNVDNAHRLRGKLLLIVGELDTNVPPESTLRVAAALIKANKDFDLLVMPGMNHSDGGLYGQRRLRDFFVRHLQEKEPPDRNGGK